MSYDIAPDDEHPFGAFRAPHADMQPSRKEGRPVEVRARGEHPDIRTVRGRIAGKLPDSEFSSFYVVEHRDGTFNSYDARTVVEYPEHEKMTAAREVSQAQGELLEWLSGQGIQLMRWREWTEPETVDCLRCWSWSGPYRRSHDCPSCANTRRCEVMREREEWVNVSRSVEQLLAAFHGIDLGEIEQERRAMLAAIRREQAT